MQPGSTPAASPQISKMDQVVTSSSAGRNVPKQKEQQRPLLNNRIRPSSNTFVSASAFASASSRTQSGQKKSFSKSSSTPRQPLAPTTPNFHAFNHLDTESSHTSYATKRPSNVKTSTSKQQIITSPQTHFPYHSVRNQVYDRFGDNPSDKVKQQKHRQLQVMPLFATKPAKPVSKPPATNQNPNMQPIPSDQERYARIKPSLQPKKTIQKVTSRDRKSVV